MSILYKLLQRLKRIEISQLTSEAGVALIRKYDQDIIFKNHSYLWNSYLSGNSKTKH